MTDAISRSGADLSTWLGYTYSFEGGGEVIAEQVTRTVYDIIDEQVRTAVDAHPYIVNGAFQKPYTLRNRVSFTRFYDKLAWFVNQPAYSLYNSSSTYSYDIHGNVDTLLHDYQVGMMAQPSINIDRFKVIAYRYDLISGKVNQVHYQPGMTDQLYHRYEYDAENRLTDVYIADNKAIIGIPVLEEHDARYSYYKHGPLAKAVLGQQLVQGIDYAYTLQGWLKGVNSDSLVDPDGSLTAIDAYRFSLNYFNGDYTAIGSSVKDLIFPGHSAGLPDEQDYRPLFNGNISSMVVGIPRLGETRLYNYGYDQLNRLTKMDAYTGYNTATHSWGVLDDHDGEYKERIAYDGNGNILTYLRNGRQGELEMDNLSYHYNRDGAGNLKNNKLVRVEDDPDYTNHYAADIGDHTADIDDQPQENYDYDAIGNLVKDSAEHIRAITWTVYGKIKAITKTDGTKINYTYDAGGNRISKSVISGTDTTTTWYVRDAQGNPMGIYSGHYGSLTLNEHHLYGSSRLGIWNRNLDMLTPPDPNNGTFARGDKFFELTDHRGNVLVTVSDRKFGHDGGGGEIDYYNPDVVNANDYYPFGMGQPGRKFSAGGLYRYGFNGKENDNEVKGEGNQQDYGKRIYDPRVGRFLSVDPLKKKYPWYTPYQFAGNTPIATIDIDGEESGIPMNGVGPSGVPLSKQLETAEGRKTWLKAMGIETAVGGTIIIDIFLTKGRLTQAFLLSQGLGLAEHNRAKTEEGRKLQDERFKENFNEFMKNAAGGYIVSKLARGLEILYSETSQLFNFGAKALGEMGEEALSLQYGTVKPTGKGSSLSTSVGARKPDGIPAGTTVASTDKLYEAKVGFQEFSGDIVNQVKKDAELLSQGQIKEITWVFYKSPNTGKVGASDQLLQELKSAGIKTEVAGDIPKQIVHKYVAKYGPTTKQ